MRTYNGFIKSDSNNALLFLDDGTLLGRRDGKGFNFWNIKSQSVEPQRSLLWLDMNTTCMELFPGDYMVRGSSNGTMDFFNLTNFNTPQVQWTAHKDSIFLLKRLKNGNLASMSYDNTINIWKLNFIEGKYKLVNSIKDHNIEKSSQYPMQELSNGYLVTFYTVDAEISSKIRVWNPADGNLVKEIETPFEIFTSCLLSNDHLVVAPLKGEMKIYNLAQGQVVRVIRNDARVIRATQLFNIYLAVIVRRKDDLYYLEIWNSQNGQLIQASPTKHAMTTSLCLSKDEKYLAIGSSDSTINVWKVTKLI